MNGLLADTHVLLWYLFEPAELSRAAESALSALVESGGIIYVSAISLVEIRYLTEKQRVSDIVWTKVILACLDSKVPIELLPVDMSVARAMDQVSRRAVPDMPDRIVAATAIANGLSLVTADRLIRSSSVPTVW